MKSPFEFSVVLKLAVVLGLVMAAARALSAVYGSQGLLPMAALAGLVDVDAVALAVSRMTANEGLDVGLAARAVLLAAAVDSASKAAIAVTLGGWRFGRLFVLGTIVAATAAVIALLAF